MSGVEPAPAGSEPRGPERSGPWRRHLAAGSLALICVFTLARLPWSLFYARDALPALLAWHDPASQHRLTYAGEAYDFLRVADARLPPGEPLLLVTPGSDVRRLEYTVFHRALYFLTPRPIVWATPAVPDGTWETRLFRSVPLEAGALRATAAAAGVRCLLAWRAQIPEETGERVQGFAGGALWALLGATPADCLRQPATVPARWFVAGAWLPRLAGALLAIFAIGGAVVAATSRLGAPGCRGLEGLARSWLLGAGALSLGMALLGAAGMPLRGQVAGLSLAAAFAAAARTRLALSRHGRPAEAVAVRVAPASPDPHSRFARRISALLGLVVAVQGLFVFSLAIGRPFWVWDAWATWGAKARTIFIDNGIAPAVYADPTRAGTLLSYPLGYPLNEAWIFTWLGAPDDRLGGIVAAISWLALAALVRGALLRWGAGEPLARAGAACAAAVPFVAGFAALAFADVPLAALAAMLAIALVDRARTESRARRGAALAAILAAALLPWTKREGALLLVCLALAAWLVERHSPSLLRALFGCLAAGTVVGGGWLLFVSRSGGGVSVGDFASPAAGGIAGAAAATLARVPAILVLEAGALLDPGWALLWAVAGAWALLTAVRALAHAARRRARRGAQQPLSRADGAALLPVAAALYLGFVTAAYTLSSYSPLEQHILTSFHRLAAQVAPLVAIWLARSAIPRPLGEPGRYDRAARPMRENPRSEAAPVRRESGLSVVMPAHDEADNLAAMLDDTCRELASTCARLEVLVVDDGSTDATPAVLAASVAAHPQLRVITLPARRGYGEAARVGLADAREELVLFTDADRQFQLADVETLLEAIGDGDLAVGYRFDRRDSPLRNGLGRAWSGLVNLLFGYTARDVDCALKLARRTALAEVLPEVRSRGAAFSAEWLIRARRAGQQIVELPVRHRPRCAGRPSGGSPAVALRGFVELLRLRATLPRRRRDRAAPGAPWRCG